MEKAWIEPRYRELYTETCKRISDDVNLTEIQEDEKEAKSDEPKK